MCFADFAGTCQRSYQDRVVQYMIWRCHSRLGCRLLGCSRLGCKLHSWEMSLSTDLLDHRSFRPVSQRSNVQSSLESTTLTNTSHMVPWLRGWHGPLEVDDTSAAKQGSYLTGPGVTCSSECWSTIDLEGFAP